MRTRRATPVRSKHFWPTKQTTPCSSSTCPPPWRARPQRLRPLWTPSSATAQANSSKPVFAVWLGEDAAAAEAFEGAGIPNFGTEADAVRGFMHLVRYSEAQDSLTKVPDSLPQAFAPAVATARQIIAGALHEGRTWLDPLEVNALLRAYDIPVAPVTLAKTPEEAAAAAQPILAEGGTVAVKILSPDIVHKSDVGGVTLDLTSEAAVRRAAENIFERAHRLKPTARMTGVTVQPMVRRPKARELIVGLAHDPTFGPVVMFGSGGTAVEVINDKALALPPLDLQLASDLVARTRVARLLKAYRNVPAADERAVTFVLVKIAQLAADLPEVRELDLNPLLADTEGVIAVDARVAVAPLPDRAPNGCGPSSGSRFALTQGVGAQKLTLRNGQRVFIRPIRPDDEGIYRAFLDRVSAQRPAVALLFSSRRVFTHRVHRPLDPDRLCPGDCVRGARPARLES